MKQIFCFLIIFLTISCGRNVTDYGNRIITVSIAPFKYFVEQIAGNDFTINVMVPPGANPHVYEPFPEQINRLRRSVGYISNGYLGFELTWMDRFYETNKTMKRLSLGDKISPLVSAHHGDGNDNEGTDPHYWVSPACGIIIATSVKEYLCELNPSQASIYETNFQNLILKIREMEREAQKLFSGDIDKSFMIFHPNLGYLARDFGLEEIPVEFEGKEPPPSRMKDLIDMAREKNLKTIFVQREYDTKNARAIADEIGADLTVIDPLSEDWLNTTSDIIHAIHSSLIESSK
jgi:zinc transport system substrate-binding protein